MGLCDEGTSGMEKGGGQEGWVLGQRCLGWDLLLDSPIISPTTLLSFLFEDSSLPSTFTSPPPYTFTHPSPEPLTAALRVNSNPPSAGEILVGGSGQSVALPAPPPPTHILTPSG